MPRTGAISIKQLARRGGCAQMAVFTDAGARLASRVSVAASFPARFIGLLTRRRLSIDEGLLLVPGGTIHTFGMRFPIDAIFLDGFMRVLAIRSSLQPWRVACAPAGTRLVLEVAAGRTADLGLTAGTELCMSRQALDVSPPRNLYDSAGRSRTARAAQDPIQ